MRSEPIRDTENDDPVTTVVEQAEVSLTDVT